MEAPAVDRDEVRQASLRLPERQRVALELRERKALSYAQIAASLGTSAGSVAQLLERARINLYDELRGTALASVAAPSAECERALPLIAARQDGELAPSSEGAAWLDAHRSSCDRCRLAAEQMGDASALFRDEAVRSPPRGEAVTQRRGAGGTGERPGPGDASSPERMSRTDSRSPAVRRRRLPSRRRAMLAGGVAALALAALVAALAAQGGSDPARSAADAASSANAAQAISPAHVVYTGHEAKAARQRSTASGAASSHPGAAAAGQVGFVATPEYAPASEAGGGSEGDSRSGPHRPTHGEATLHPAMPKSTPGSGAKSKPPPSSTQASQPIAQPASQPAPVTPTQEPATPAEEATAEHGHKGEPPGKPADRPPHG